MIWDLFADIEGKEMPSWMRREKGYTLHPWTDLAAYATLRDSCCRSPASLRGRLPKAPTGREWIGFGDPLAYHQYDAKREEPQISSGPKVELAREPRFFGGRVVKRPPFGGWTPEVASREASSRGVPSLPARGFALSGE